jgi:hypothetical protein
MALVLTQPLTEKSTRNLPGGKARPVRKTNNLAAICESLVQKMWDPQHLTTLQAYTECYGDSFIFLYVDEICTSQETQCSKVFIL